MDFYPVAIEKLIEEFAKLPGIGSKTAQRLTLHILNLPNDEVQQFAKALVRARGTIKYCSASPDYFEFYTEDTGTWNRQVAGSDFKPASTFPSPHVPPGWLRSMIHAHYVFLTGNNTNEFVPGIEHGLAVQRLVTQTAEHLKTFRKLVAHC